MERWILLKGFYYIIQYYNRFYYIIQFIELYEWINSVGCIFKDIEHIQLICMLREKNLFQIFLWIFCDVQRMKRVETLKCLASMKGLNAHVFQKLDWKYLDFRRINDAIYITTHKWVFQLRQLQSHILERWILLKGFTI